MTARTDAVRDSRGAFGLMFDRMFGALFWGKMFAVIGIWTHSLVAAVVVHDATGSAFMVGLVGVVQFGPQLILTPISGKWADLGNPVRQIVVGRFLCVLGSGTIAVLLLWMPDANGHEVTLVVLGGSLLVGLGFVVGGPAMQSIVPALIRDGELPTAMALNSVPMTMGRMVGPVVGAIIAAQLSPAAAFIASAAMNSVFVVLLSVVRFPRPRTRVPGTDFRVRTAVRHAWRDRPLRLALVAVATVGFASDPAITLVPSLAAELGGGTGLVGQLSASFGIGAALALAVLATLRGRVPSGWAASIGLWLLAIGSITLAISAWSWLATAGFVIAGCGFGCAMTGLSTVVQERAPDELRGRIMALWMVGFVGSRPFAAAALGGGADLVSAHAAFAFSSAVVIVTAIFCRPGKLK